MSMQQRMELRKLEVAGTAVGGALEVKTISGGEAKLCARHRKVTASILVGSSATRTGGLDVQKQAQKIANPYCRKNNESVLRLTTTSPCVDTRGKGFQSCTKISLELSDDSQQLHIDCYRVCGASHLLRKPWKVVSLERRRRGTN
jgi:hypothetical protein